MSISLLKWRDSANMLSLVLNLILYTMFKILKEIKLTFHILGSWSKQPMKILVTIKIIQIGCTCTKYVTDHRQKIYLQIFFNTLINFMSKSISEVSGLNLHLPQNMKKNHRKQIYDIWGLEKYLLRVVVTKIVSNDAKNMYMYIISYPQYKYWNNMNDLDILSL